MVKMDAFDVLQLVSVPFRTIRELRKWNDGIILKPGESFYIYGKSGTGKTVLAAKILKEYITTRVHMDFLLGALDPSSEHYDRWYSPNLSKKALFVSVPGLLQELKRSFNSPGTKDFQLMDQCMEVDLLVLDDLGAEASTDWAYQMLYLIINDRYGKMKRTIFTSNKPLAELGRELGDDRLISRIVEMCGPDGVRFMGEENHRLNNLRGE